MKPTVVSADALFEEFRATLRWEWVAGLGASERRFDELVVSAARSGADRGCSYMWICRLAAGGEIDTGPHC